jgi:hypothetical protein
MKKSKLLIFLGFFLISITLFSMHENIPKNASDFIVLADYSHENIPKSASDFIRLAGYGHEARMLARRLANNQSESISALFTRASRFIELARVNHDTANTLATKQSESISALFTRASYFIKLAKVEGFAAKTLATKQSESILALFTQASDFIKLTDVGSYAANALVEKQSESISGLFTQASDFIKLAKVSSYAANALVEKQSELISALFTQASDFIELAKVDSFSANTLAMKQSESISALFTRASDFIELAKVDYGPGRRYDKHTVVRLANKQSKPIAILFAKDEKDLKDLIRVRKSLGKRLLDKQGNFLGFSLRALRHFPSLSLFCFGMLDSEGKMSPLLLPEIISQIGYIVLMLCQQEEQDKPYCAEFLAVTPLAR